jgi:hypothetical protein
VEEGRVPGEWNDAGRTTALFFRAGQKVERARRLGMESGSCGAYFGVAPVRLVARRCIHSEGM